MHFPGPEVAREIDAGWRAATNGARLRYVVGGIWLAGNVAYYSADRPSVFLVANPAFSPWVDEADLRRRGAVVIWDGGPDGPTPPPRFAAGFANLIVQPLLVIPRRAWVPTPPVYLEWAIVPPSPD
jgi:hypothetical protein